MLRNKFVGDIYDYLLQESFEDDFEEEEVREKRRVKRVFVAS